MLKGIKVKSLKRIDKTEKVYDFEVKDAHHYIFSNGVVSHNSYVPMRKQGGGDGIVYAASTIISFSKKKDKDATGAVTGAEITAKLDKSRLTIEQKKVETLLDYKNGLDRYYGLLPLAEKFGIVKKVSIKYEFPNGVSAKESEILSNPSKYFTKDILDMIDEECKNEFLYGKNKEDVTKEVENENEEH